MLAPSLSTYTPQPHKQTVGGSGGGNVVEETGWVPATALIRSEAIKPPLGITPLSSAPPSLPKNTRDSIPDGHALYPHRPSHGGPVLLPAAGRAGARVRHTSASSRRYVRSSTPGGAGVSGHISFLPLPPQKQTKKKRKEKRLMWCIQVPKEPRPPVLPQ